MENKIIFIASDVHGSLSALEKTLNFAREFHADKIFLLGDIFGANPSEMVELLNNAPEQLTIVRGNNDWYFDEQLYGAKFKIFEKTYEFVNGKTAYLEHGHRVNIEMLSKYSANIVIIGHLHIPILRRENGIILLCPGSMSQPRSSVGRTFAVVRGNNISIFDEEKSLISSLDF